MHAYSDSDWATCPSLAAPSLARSFSYAVLLFPGCPGGSRLLQHPLWRPNTLRLTTQLRTLSGFALCCPISPLRPTPLYIDNESARSLAHNPVHHACSKHIDVKFHWLREQVLAGILTVTHVDTNDQKAGMLTKPKTGEPFHRNAMQLVTSILS
jgi:hypothetical protein